MTQRRYSSSNLWPSDIKSRIETSFCLERWVNSVVSWEFTNARISNHGTAIVTPILIPIHHFVKDIFVTFADKEMWTGTLFEPSCALWKRNKINVSTQSLCFALIIQHSFPHLLESLCELLVTHSLNYKPNCGTECLVFEGDTYVLRWVVVQINLAEALVCGRVNVLIEGHFNRLRRPMPLVEGLNLRGRQLVLRAEDNIDTENGSSTSLFAAQPSISQITFLIIQSLYWDKAKQIQGIVVFNWAILLKVGNQTRGYWIGFDKQQHVLQLGNLSNCGLGGEVSRNPGKRLPAISWTRVFTFLDTDAFE